MYCEWSLGHSIQSPFRGDGHGVPSTENECISSIIQRQKRSYFQGGKFLFFCGEMFWVLGCGDVACQCSPTSRLNWAAWTGLVVSEQPCLGVNISRFLHGVFLSHYQGLAPLKCVLWETQQSSDLSHNLELEDEWPSTVEEWQLFAGDQAPLCLINSTRGLGTIEVQASHYSMFQSTGEQVPLSMLRNT